MENENLGDLEFGVLNSDNESVSVLDMDNHIQEPIKKEDLIPCLIEAVKKVTTWKNIDPSRLKKQISTCVKIIEGIVDGKTNFVIDAPTGFGKSILALLVDEMFKIAIEKSVIKLKGDSYILVPNKILQDQYQNDIAKFELDKSHAQLKGQSNYKCLDDITKNFSNRPCNKYSIKQLKDGKMSCGVKCPYILARDKAILSNTTVFNYNYFLTSMNYTFNAIGDASPFKPRALTIFDECHTLAKIVQDMFETKIDFVNDSYELESNFSIIQQMYAPELIASECVTMEDIDKVMESILVLRESQKVYFNYVKLIGDKISTPLFQNVLDELTKSIALINGIIKIYSYVITKYFPSDDDEFSRDLTDIEKELLDMYEYMNSIVTQITNIINTINECGVDSLVLDTKEEIIKAKERKYVTFRCVKDDELIKKHVLTYTQYSIFMSATIGSNNRELKEWSISNGIENPYIISIDSDFDFTNSPILLMSPYLSMANKDKDKNMPMMLERIETIMLQHPKECGLIHTGNYEFMNILKNYVEVKGIDSRFIWCDSAITKKEGIELIKWDIQNNGWSNRILVGASLLEGLDLKDDLCRFNVFMKVPYQSMADALVKRKMKIYPNWYSWETMISFLQGIGRSNRHKNDKSVVYLLDSSFKNFFYYYGELPKIVKNRLRYVDIKQWFGSNIITEHETPPNSPPMPIIEDDDVVEEQFENSIFGGVTD